MSDDDIIYYASQTLTLVMVLSLPTVMIAALVGVLVGLVQALTQIQEQTIQFAIRLIAIGVALAMSMRWTGVELYRFTLEMFDSIPLLTR